MKKYGLLFVAVLLVGITYLFQKGVIHNEGVKIDVVIPCAQKDVETLDICIQGIRKNGVGVRRVIVVSPERYTTKAEWISEDEFPFANADIATAILGDRKEALAYLDQPNNRIGWLFQQLVKIYAPYVIPNLRPNYLVLDADTIYLNKTRFFDERGTPMYNISYEDHPAYFAHAKRLFPSIVKTQDTTGIAHCMVFQRAVIEQMFEESIRVHGCELWEAFCRAIDPTYLDSSAASEYQIYFHYLLSHHIPMKVHQLRWRNSSNLDKLSRYKRRHFNYVSFHTYLRETREERHEGKKMRHLYL